MILVPAIDLVEGRCVRLAQGDFGRETRYSDDPAAALVAFAQAGPSEVHIVDLDGAKARQPRQHDLLIALAANTGLALQVAGGFRTIEHVERMIGAGIADPALFSRMIERFGPERLTLALDVRIEDGRPIVATHGWMTGSGEGLSTVIGRFPTIRHLLVTDIARDGMLAGPNVSLMETIAAQFPTVELQASGGVATLDDLDTLRTTGARRAIVGKAIWERRFTVTEGVARARG